MTASSADNVWSLPRFEPVLRQSSSASDKLDEAVILRRCAMFRKGFPGAAVAYPADVVGVDAVGNWVRREGLIVDVESTDELDQVVAAGIPPLRIVAHRADGVASLIRHAANIGVGRFVLDSTQQIAILADSAERTRRVMVDVTRRSADELAAQIGAHRRLELVGLHCRLGDSDDVAAVVPDMISQMAWLRREYGVTLMRIGLGDLDAGECDVRGLRRVADIIDEAVENSCARHRYPRPVLTLSPSRSALLSPA